MWSTDWRLLALGLLCLAETSLADGRAGLGELMQCYTNLEYYDRELRPTMTMENLIYLIRKIEMHPASTYVDIRQLLFTLLHRYRKDGFQKIPNSNGGILQVKEDKRSMGLLNHLSTDLTNPSFVDLPPGALDIEEECALHWMLSHTVNNTRREEEDPGRSRGKRRSHLFVKRQVSEGLYSEGKDSRLTTQRPIEMGVVYSKVGGTVSGGLLLTGIALGLENTPATLESVFPDLISDEMKGEIIEPLYASTLSGEIGEGSILKEPWADPEATKVVGPSGQWKDECCPREYILDGPRTPVTVAEINGAVDGLLIGLDIQEYSRKGTRLSQVLQMYYSERGMAHDFNTRACDRSRIFTQRIDRSKLIAQARNYASLYASMYKDSLTLPVTSDDPVTLIDQAVAVTTEECIKVLEKGAGTDYDSCQISPPSSDVGTMPSENYYDFYFILDTYLASEEELKDMKSRIRDFLSVHDIGLFKTRVAIFVARASDLETVSHFNNPPGGYNALCKLMVHETESSNKALSPKDMISKFSAVVQEDLSYEKKNELGGTNGKVVVLLSPRSKFRDPQYHKEAFDKFYLSYPDFNIFIMTDNPDYKKIISAKYVMKYETDVDEFSKHLETVPERLIYPHCWRGEREGMQEHRVYVSPHRTKFIAYSGKWFEESSKFVIRLATSSRDIRVCASREDPRPVMEIEDRVLCVETREGQQAVDIKVDNPCYTEICKPVYMSVTSNETSSDNDVICVEPGCNYIDQTEVTITHSGMRCGCSAITTAIWLLILGLTATRFPEYFL